MEKIDETSRNGAGRQLRFRELRRSNERRAYVTALLEARRQRDLQVERVLQVQRQRRVGLPRHP